MDFIPIHRSEDHFQRTLNEFQINVICKRAFGTQVSILSVQELPAGMFNSTYYVQIKGYPKLILRVSPDPASFVFYNELLLLRREFTVQPYLAPVAEVIPKTIMADFTHQLVERDYVFQEYLEGELWDEIKDNLSSVENEQLWEQLGRISRDIHQVHGSHFGYQYPMKQFSSWSEAVVDMIVGMQNDLVKLQLSTEGIARYLEILQAGRMFLEEIETPLLLHGDLWPKNVLVDRHGTEVKIVGLLDSERAVWGDPYAEWVFNMFDLHPAFWIGYGARMDNLNAHFRDLVYKGMYSIQLFLEAWRFKYDDSPFRQLLTHVTGEMQSILSK